MKEEQVKAQPFSLPPTNEQRRIVEKIETLFADLDAGVESLTRARARLALYQQSVLKAAFEGRLTADWRAENPDKLEDPETLLARIEKERAARYKQALDDWQEAQAAWRANDEKGKKPAKPTLPPSVSEFGKAELVSLPSLPSWWTWLRLGSAFWLSPKNGLYKPASDYGSGTGIIRIDDFYDGKLIRKSGFKCLRLSEEEEQQFLVAEGDILVNRVNSLDYLGKCAVAPKFDDATVFESNIMKCHSISVGVTPEWIVQFLSSREGKNRIRKNAKHAVNQASINQHDVAATPVPVCSPAEQAEILRRLEATLSNIDALEAQIDDGLARSKALRQSILKRAFGGQLVAQDASDEPAHVLLDRIKAEKATVVPQRRRRRA